MPRQPRGARAGLTKNSTSPAVRQPETGRLKRISNVRSRIPLQPRNSRAVHANGIKTGSTALPLQAQEGLTNAIQARTCRRQDVRRRHHERRRSRRHVRQRVCGTPHQGGHGTDVPPFEFVNTQTGEVSGFEMDLVRAVGKELGAKIEFQVLSFDAIIPAMLSGTVEMGAAGFSITEERKKRVLYSDTFYTSGLSLVTTKAKAGAVKSMKDLEGKTIGVQIGTTSHNAAKKVKGAKIVTFNTAGEAILDLSIGGSDAVINDRPVTAYIMTQQPKLGAQLVHQPETYSADDFAFVFRKDQSALKDEVNAALAKLKSNGEYDKIYNKWFGKN
ncbi:MAG: basic amino acid ABC transporter substrate-binding protein [Sutterella wadsworthensis]